MSVLFEGAHCTLTLDWPAPGVTLVVFTGKDTNEFGDAPFQELDAHLAPGTELYIDARKATAASIDVSAEWAKWLGRRKGSFARVSMLTGSKFIQMSADFVRRFADLGELMRLYTDAVAFEHALQISIASRG
ncbi:MAG: hypothetical protein JNK82_01035 [Myxococcaceae bacterium]|nr:hypothetical protein [Myxococcaceae bacterium]